MIRILLVEKMCLLRRALAAVLSLEDDLDVTAELARLDEMLPMARAVRPDVVIIDIDLLADDCAATLSELNDQQPECAVLVLGDADAPGRLRRLLDVHVGGFICKHTAPDQLAGSIRRAARGERVIDPSLAVAALVAPENPLSHREYDVLCTIASGKPSNEAAAALHLSAGTVRNYVSAILRKTGARNRVEAIRIAEAAGWLW